MQGKLKAALLGPFRLSIPTNRLAVNVKTVYKELKQS